MGTASTLANTSQMAHLCHEGVPGGSTELSKHQNQQLKVQDPLMAEQITSMEKESSSCETLLSILNALASPTKLDTAKRANNKCTGTWAHGACLRITLKNQGWMFKNYS